MQFLDLLLILAVLILNHALNELRGLVPELIVTDVQLDLAVVDIDNMRTNVVEEMAVMRNDQHCTLELGQKILQPANRLNIQMVGRLVKQQDIRLAKQRARQQHLDLFHVTEILHFRIRDRVRVQPQAIEQLTSLGLGIPAAHFGKLSLELGSTVAVLLGKRVLHIKRVFLPHDLEQTRVAAEHCVQHSFLIELKVVLLEYAHARFGRDRYRASGRVKVPRQDAQERRFTRAVGADNAVAVAFGEFQVNIFKQRLAAEI